jgi:hypothetical protein
VKPGVCGGRLSRSAAPRIRIVPGAKSGARLASARFSRTVPIWRSMLYRSKSHRCTSNQMSVFIDDAADNRIRRGAMPTRTASTARAPASQTPSSAARSPTGPIPAPVPANCSAPASSGPHQGAKLHRLTCNDDFSSGTGFGKTRQDDDKRCACRKCHPCRSS